MICIKVFTVTFNLCKRNLLISLYTTIPYTKIDYGNVKYTTYSKLITF